MFKFRSNSGQKCSPEPEPEPEQKGCSGTETGTGILVYELECMEKDAMITWILIPEKGRRDRVV